VSQEQAPTLDIKIWFVHLLKDLSNRKSNVCDIKSNKKISVPFVKDKTTLKHQDDENEQHRCKDQYGLRNAIIFEPTVGLKIGSKARINSPTHPNKNEYL
jgi:hypothetical protein